MMRLCPKDGIKTEHERCPECGTATLVLAQNPDSRLKEGTEINGRYCIDKMIGQGGFGAVYKATHLATDQEMAIKVLGVSLDSDESDLIQRFFAEAQITAGLKHPNTIRVFDFGQTEGGALYIAMELLSGKDLNQLLKERKELGEALSEEDTVRITSQTLRSLAEAHMAGLVHRDLKPHNIFLNEVPGDDPVVKVLDFGIAKRLGSNLTGTGQAFGTPSYMSPEQAQNRPIDARSDIYSLGVVMYQCLALRPPFEGDNPLAVLLSHVTDSPPPLSETAKTPVSAELQAIVEKALAKDPFDRFESAIEMRKVLASLGRSVTNETMLSLNQPSSVSSSSMPAAPQAPTATKSERFRNTDHGKQLNVDNIDSEDATQAYNIASVKVVTDNSGAFGPTEIAPAENAATDDVSADAAAATNAAAQGGSGYTEAFMLRGDGIIDKANEATDTVQEDAYELPKKSNKGVFALVGIGIVAALAAVGIAMSGGGGEEPAKASPAAVAAAEESPAEKQPAQEAAKAPDEGEAKTEQAAAADAGGTEGADAGKEAPPAPDTNIVEVELKTEPAGASVEINGTVIGKTPLKLKVEENKPMTGFLALPGYHKRDFFVMHTDAPGKSVTLNKKVAATKRPRRRPVAKPSPRPKPKPVAEKKPDRPKVRSALEERL